MSRCKACDTILNDSELKKKDPLTGHHLDLCSVCLSYSNDAILDMDSGAGDNNLDLLGLEVDNSEDL
jgi:hypothetical protein